MLDNIPTYQAPASGDVIACRQRVLTVDPALAAQWLANHNPRNRIVKPGVVGRYARDMLNGRWKFTGDPIQFDKHGDLLNGQHRLRAVVESGCTIRFSVWEGLESEAQGAMDGGKMRTAADQLAIDGWASSDMVSGIARLALRMEANNLGTRKLILSTPEVRDFATRDPERMQAAARLGKTLRSLPLSRPPAGLFAYLALGLAAEHPSLLDPLEVEVFYQSLATGANLPVEHPITTLRNTLLARRTGTWKKRQDVWTDMFYLVRVWNASRTGERLQKLQLPTGSVITLDHLKIRPDRKATGS